MRHAAWLPLAAMLSRTRYPQTTTEPATAWMREAAGLLVRQGPWVLAALLLVLGLLLVTAVRLRGRRAPTPEASATGAAVPLALLWTLTPIVLVALVALPRLLHVLDPLRASVVAGDTVRVQVIGHQWWWELRYPELDVLTATDLHVPVGSPVSVTLESADVAHSLWIPAVAPRQDVAPLRRRTFTFTPDREGVFPGQCGEWCGASHAHMHVRLIVESEPAFRAWVEAQRAAAAATDSLHRDALWLGQQVFAGNACRGCHTVRGLSESPVGPDLTHLASRGTIGSGLYERTDANLARWILHASTLKPGSMMPDSPLPERQLKQLVAWLQSLR